MEIRHKTTGRVLLRVNADTLAGANLRCRNLKGADLRGADLRGAYLLCTNLAEADLEGAYLTDVNTRTDCFIPFFWLLLCLILLLGWAAKGSTYEETVTSIMGIGFFALVALTLFLASARSVSLRSADLRGADLTKAELQRVDLSAALLHQTILEHANLESANLCGAQLCNARMAHARLGSNSPQNPGAGADLRGADLRGADLATAHLSGADLRGARYDDRTRWPAGFDPGAGRSRLGKRTTRRSLNCSALLSREPQRVQPPLRLRPPRLRLPPACAGLEGESPGQPLHATGGLVNQFITATATNVATGDTSEFSQAKKAS